MKRSEATHPFAMCTNTPVRRIFAGRARPRGPGVLPTPEGATNFQHALAILAADASARRAIQLDIRCNKPSARTRPEDIMAMAGLGARSADPAQRDSPLTIAGSLYMGDHTNAQWIFMTTIPRVRTSDRPGSARRRTLLRPHNLEPAARVFSSLNSVVPWVPSPDRSFRDGVQEPNLAPCAATLA